MTVIDLLGATPAVLQLPIGKEADFAGVVDLVQMKAIIWKDESLGAEFDVTDIPDDLKEKAAEYREKLVELAVEQDEELLMAYLEGEEPSIEDLKGCSRCSTPSSTTCRRRPTSRRSRGRRSTARRTWCASRPMMSRSRRSRSRSWPTRSSARSRSRGCTRAASRRARRCSTR